MCILPLFIRQTTSKAVVCIKELATHLKKERETRKEENGL